MISVLFSLALGVVFAALSVALGWKTERAQTKSTRSLWFLVPAQLLTLLSGLCFWTAQTTFSQMATSRPVVDCFVDHETKVLKVTNAGATEIEDIRVFVTTYTLARSTEKDARPNTFVGLERYSGSWMPIGLKDRLKRGGATYELPLQSPRMPVISFHDPNTTADEDSSWNTVYCLRIGFRNAVTKDHHYAYRIISPFRGVPDMFQIDQKSSFTGPVATANRYFAIRQQIWEHQAKLFEDDPAEIFRN